MPLFVEGIDDRGFDTKRHKCLLSRIWATLIVPPVLDKGPVCKGTSRFCCLESRCALPCDEEVPFMFGMCFLICYKDGNFEVSFNNTPAPAIAKPGVDAAQVTVTTNRGAPVTADMER